MVWINFALYTIAMVLVWGFFLVAKIHVFKFRDYSPAVVPVTRYLAMTLLALTFLGYYSVFFLANDSKLFSSSSSSGSSLGRWNVVAPSTSEEETEKAIEIY